MRAASSGNPAIVGRAADRPVALRPRLSTGLLCFTVEWNSAARVGEYKLAVSQLADRPTRSTCGEGSRT